MGKSRLSQKGSALERKKPISSEDKSRHENNQLTVSGPLNSSDDDQESYSLHQTVHLSTKDYNDCVEDLHSKRGPTREKALLVLVFAFERSVLVKFVETTYITLLYRYINSMKVGSSYEAYLASRAIGLLSITVGSENSSHELMKESVLQLSQSLESGSDPFKISVLECLGIITFFGANDVDEVEKSMEIMWESCHPKSTSKAGPVSTPTSAVSAAAISAWSFLLTTIDGGRISSKRWKESLSFLCNLLEMDDCSINIAVGEAITTISETGRIDKFCREEGGVDNLSKANSEPQGFVYIQSVKDKIINQVRKLSKKAKGKGSDKKDLNNQHDFFQKILVFLETGNCPEISTRIHNKRGTLKVSTWAKLIQLRFLKHFLGSGFLKHMQDNEVLHDSFDFGLEEKGNPLLKEKVRFRAPPSTRKEKTQLRNMQRMCARDRKHGDGHYAVDYDE